MRLKFIKAGLQTLFTFVLRGDGNLMLVPSESYGEVNNDSYMEMKALIMEWLINVDSYCKQEQLLLSQDKDRRDAIVGLLTLVMSH
jgi:hypothetical protein